MTLKIRVGAAALIFALASGFAAAPVEPVLAQGFFERLFGQQRYDYRDRQQVRDYRARERRRREMFRQSPTQRQLPATPVRVEGPKYYGYKPDALKAVSFASLAEVVTASAEPDDLRLGTTPFGEARGHLETFRMRTLAEVGKAVKEYYSENPQFIWVTDWRVNGKARAAMAALERAGNFGLSAGDYRVEAPKYGFGTADETTRQKRAIEFEMEMSAKVLTYVLDATRGRIDPNRISGYHDFKRKTVDLAGALRIVAATDDVGNYLDARNPDNAPFKALAAELAQLRATEDVDHIEIAAGTFLKPGAVSPELANVIAAIGLRGSDALKADHEATLDEYDDGEAYTPELVALVRDFQREKGLGADGIIGKKTVRALTTVSVRQKIEKVELAMERLRWLPRDLGSRHVFINQPAFTATYMNAGRAQLSMRAIVGKKSNQTNFFMDRIESVEYNPYWGVPRSIIVNEMLPKLFNDPSYLDRLGYEVTTVSGERVSSEWVDWYSVGVDKAPINVRQPPGPKNALGDLKILFPNKHAIYMHDTPAKKLFNRDSRAFSHGCVRLQKPREMAAAVLGKSEEYIASRIAQGRNESDPVTANIPVYVAYFTAWPNSEGTVRYYSDIYDRDMYLSRAIKRTDSARHAES
jgi:murein L,D-transpeptidase YcbB/YkuD